MDRLLADTTTSPQRDAERRAGLRRMRVVATSLLLLMLMVFVLSSKFEASVPALAYLRAFAEAGMVGACADWFAVVALFRHPLGLPIPHTAILPRNKQRIADTLGRFFSRHFFNSGEVARRLEQVDVARWLAGWLRSGDNVRLIAEWSRGMLPPTIELLGGSQLRGASRDIIKNCIDSISAAPLVGRLLSVLIAQGHHTAAYDYGLKAAIRLLGDNRAVFRQKVGERTSAWLRGWADARLADTFLDAVIDTLAAARAADHPWRRDYRVFLDGWVKRFSEDQEIDTRCEQIKTNVLDNKLVDDYLGWLAAEAESKLRLDSDANAAVGHAVERMLMAFGEWLESNDRVRDAINHSARELVMNTLVPRRDDIGAYVSDIVAGWDNKTLVERLELSVGKDLQFIRVNGTLVGGAVGLALYTLTRVIG